MPERQMLSVYFDTIVYSHIEKGWIAKDVVDALREALLTGKLSAHLSVTNVEELLGQWKTDRPAAIRKLCLARDLVGFEKLLKPPNVLLEEAIRAYASETSPPSPFLPEDQCRTVVSSLRRIENGDVIIDGTVSGIISQVGVLKHTALEQWTEGRREVHSTLSPESVEARHPQRKDINWFLKSEEQTYAEGLAKTVGLDKACRFSRHRLFVSGHRLFWAYSCFSSSPRRSLLPDCWYWQQPRVYTGSVSYTHLTLPTICSV